MLCKVHVDLFPKFWHNFKDKFNGDEEIVINFPNLYDVTTWILSKGVVKRTLDTITETINKTRLSAGQFPWNWSHSTHFFPSCPLKFNEVGRRM